VKLGFFTNQSIIRLEFSIMKVFISLCLHFVPVRQLCVTVRKALRSFPGSEDFAGRKPLDEVIATAKPTH